MTGLDHLWAGWRATYVNNEAAIRQSDCVFCGLRDADCPPQDSLIIHRTAHAMVLLNAYPYTTGHLLVMPTSHVGGLEEITDEASQALWGTIAQAVAAVKRAYQPEGLNVGFNLGRAAGAGIPTHLHAHVVPRWEGDTNFMTTIAQARVLPETLLQTWEKISNAWSGDTSATTTSRE